MGKNMFTHPQTIIECHNRGHTHPMVTRHYMKQPIFFIFGEIWRWLYTIYEGHTAKWVLSLNLENPKKSKFFLSQKKSKKKKSQKIFIFFLKCFLGSKDSFSGANTKNMFLPQLTGFNMKRPYVQINLMLINTAWVLVNTLVLVKHLQTLNISPTEIKNLVKNFFDFFFVFFWLRKFFRFWPKIQNIYRI